MGIKGMTIGKAGVFSEGYEVSPLAESDCTIQDNTAQALVYLIS